MAGVVFRFGMAFCGFALVMLVLCSSVNGLPSDGTKTTPANATTPTKQSSTVKPTAGKPNTTITPTTGNPTTVKPTTGNHSTVVPTSHHGNHSTATPTGNHSTAAPTTHGNHSTAATTTNKTPTPTPGAHGGDHHSDRGKWVATGFAVFFLITTIVMTVLYCRQRKIYRELEGDSSLSRLI